MSKSAQGPQGNRRTVTKGSTANNRQKGRRRQRATNRPAATLTSKQMVTPSKDISPAPTVSLPTPRIERIVPQSHIISDLKRIGIIAGAMLLILIILYLVL